MQLAGWRCASGLEAAARSGSSDGELMIGRSNSNPAALESFWEQADSDSSSEHPLEREIAEREDALSRYRMLIEDAQAQGREDLADILIGQQERQAVVVRGLREALRRMRLRGG